MIRETNNISAFIVAGGKGARLGELGEHTQKCMLELWGKPMLYYLIILLRNAGCSKIVIAVNHLSEQVKDYFRDGKDLDVEIEYVENSFISTYDALYQSLNHLSDRILYIHANILFQNTLLKDVISLGNQSDKNVIAVIPNNNLTLKHAQVSIDNSGNISAIDLTERNNKYPYTFLGVAYYKKQDFITQFNGSSAGMMEKLIQQLLDVNVLTLAYQYKGDWRHIETETDYLQIKEEQKWETNHIQFTPSLVINVTDNCNMNCIYCPPFGENLCQGKNAYDTNAVKTLIQLARQNNFQTVRFTGGEPLLFPEILKLLFEECGKDIPRLVLNTNGALLHKHFDWLEKYKDHFVLKISFDSSNSDEYNELTQTFNFDTVFGNIKAAIDKKFRIEINVVLVNQKLENIKQLISYFTEKNVPMKILTLSNYYGNVDMSICNFDLDGLLNYLESVSEESENEQLNGNRGISMLKYTINNTAILFVDHSCKSSRTPIKCYFSDCRKSCNLFPCDSGALSISLSTDGSLSICRGNKNLGVNVFNEKETVIKDCFNSLLKQFDNCIEINVNSIN
jgi:molybdenum cofactor biosynthesis enzyme MoaA/dTDP-glucose pyrophosphorylase